MYRNSAQVNNYTSRNALPSPDNTNTSDSEADIVDILDRKRKELDDEISKFKAVKDREFRDFEKDLRSRRRTRACDISPSKTSSSVNPSPLSLLGSTQNGCSNGWGGGHKVKRGGGDRVGDKITRPPPLSKPTLSLDKLNINGETLLPAHNLGTPPTPSFLPKRSPTNTSAMSTPPRAQQTNKQPPTPGSEKSDGFAGVFTPVYLPLLESRDQPLCVDSPQDLSTKEEEKKRLQLDEDTKQEAEWQRLQLESSHSLPEQPVSPTVLASKRTRSDPQMGSSMSNLPSALRTPSGTHGHKQKKKHVTFQLADSKVVEPSSSYEESPVDGASPTPSSNSSLSFQSRVEDVDGDQNRYTHEENAKSNESNGSTPTKSPSLRERRRGKGGRFLSPMPSPLPSPAPSPTINGDSILLVSASPDESGFSGGLSGADDGGSGVGFFELDEELASPGLREKPMELEGEGDLDKDLTDGGASAKAARREENEGVGSFRSGSVPIDIVRPNGMMTPSWVGSFGH
ncbi:hypothetical protein PV05_11455 [Exophiala xenobiotica]|uniref:Uncharacterized protein n=1 Tax=Exophiala xenobiotica TaxID=348802 RepID=A0A0D2E4X2_9EURO|nr:uncharacterized protein PV05_11455 [Exophiala xenobiotica]KIW49810.1 hypothetical protein PV05_11455 [Exophiala xenobiotica]